MILWINGAFGAGKTTIAHELHRRIPHSFVYDPENAGSFIRDNLPEQLSKGDFQDFPLWREFNYSMLRHIYREFPGTIIVPMTIVNPQYLHEIAGRLRHDGAVLHHFALRASRETLLQRLLSRGEGEDSWAAGQMDRCIDGLSSDVFRHHLDTDKLSVEALTAIIASMANIELLP